MESLTRSIGQRIGRLHRLVPTRWIVWSLLVAAVGASALFQGIMFEPVIITPALLPVVDMMLP